MKDISGIDENGNPIKMGLSSCTSKTAWSLVKVNLSTERNQESGPIFSTMARCNLPGTTKTEKLPESGYGTSRMANREVLLALMMKSRSTVNGNGVMPMVNSGTKVTSSMAKRKAPSKSIIRCSNN